MDLLLLASECVQVLGRLRLGNQQKTIHQTSGSSPVNIDLQLLHLTSDSHVLLVFFPMLEYVQQTVTVSKVLTFFAYNS